MIGRIRNYISRRGLGLSSRKRSSRRRGKRSTVDHHASFSMWPGEEWTYEGDEIYLNGEPVENFIQPGNPDVQQWSHMLDSLQAYQDWAYTNGAPKFQKMAYTINGVQEKLLKRLKRVYDNRMGGITLSWGDGELLLNNVNVRALMAMYHVRPTEKARIFLEGLKSKLALILYRHSGNPQVSHTAHVVQNLYADLCQSLTRETIDSRCLSSGSGTLVESAP